MSRYISKNSFRQNSPLGTLTPQAHTPVKNRAKWKAIYMKTYTYIAWLYIEQCMKGKSRAGKQATNWRFSRIIRAPLLRHAQRRKGDLPSSLRSSCASLCTQLALLPYALRTCAPALRHLLLAPRQRPSCAHVGAPLLTLGYMNVLMHVASLAPAPAFLEDPTFHARTNQMQKSRPSLNTCHSKKDSRTPQEDPPPRRFVSVFALFPIPAYRCPNFPGPTFPRF